MKYHSELSFIPYEVSSKITQIGKEWYVYHVQFYMIFAIIFSHFYNLWGHIIIKHATGF